MASAGAPLGFERDDPAVTPAQDAVYQLRRRHRLARFKRVKIGDDDAPPLQPVPQIQRKCCSGRPVAERVAGRRR
jgi:hypothetical protein